jgi:glycosyltransferase involved in cell wall biosynthesis
VKVCVLTHTFPRDKEDVAAAFMKGFSDGLVEAGNKVVVVTPFDQRFLRRGDPFKIVTYKYIWPNSLHIMGYSRAMKADVSLGKSSYLFIPFLTLFGTLALLRVIRKEKINLINVHWILPNGLMALIVSKLTGVPFVVTLPGTDAYLAHRYKIFGWIARWIAQNSSGITSNSSWHLDRILKLGVKNKPIAIISYPTDVTQFKPLKRGLKKIRERHGLKKNNLIILAVGRLVYKKGFNYLIKAMTQIVKRFPTVRLVIGGEGDLMEDWKSLTLKLGIKKNILFIGNIRRDEIIYYYNLADVMVAPSIVDKKGNVDGGPVVSFESMACAKPQIVTSVLGVADIIEDGVNGFVIPQKDSKAIAKVVIELLGSKKLREDMGKANRKLITSGLSTGGIGKRYTKFFKGVLEEKC